MTAINAFLRADRIEFLTDGGLFDEEFRLAHLTSKIFTIPHQNCAIASRGTKAIEDILFQRLRHGYVSFDHIVHNLGSAMPNFLKEEKAQLDQWGPYSPDSFEIVIGGWSDTAKEMQLWALINPAPPGVPAWAMLRVGLNGIPPAYITPYSAEMGVGLAAQGVDMQKVAGFSARKEGLKIIHAQRHFREGMLPGGESVRAVGGFAELTTITRNSITSTILERWREDVIGERLG